MKIILTIFLFVLGSVPIHVQDDITPVALIQRVQRAQAKLKTAIYTVNRIDTLLSGDLRRMSGKVIVQVDPTDTLLGFHFWAKKDHEKAEKIYDGRIGYEVNPEHKTYVFINTASGLHNLLLSGGGHLVMPDLIKLDTSKASGFTVSADEEHYYLTINYPDLQQYDVLKRRKTVSISKLTMLPIAVRQHQESLGKIQDLYFEAQNLQTNVAVAYDFSSLSFLKEYRQSLPVASRDSTVDMMNKPIPVFELESFDGTKVSSNDFKGKVILLDFWEVWCGPCIESMPKVQQLYQKYKNKGLLVYGITNDLKQLSSTRSYVKNRNISFPILIGNEQIKRDYKLNSVPFYVLVDRDGNASMVALSYPKNLEEIIVKSLTH